MEARNLMALNWDTTEVANPPHLDSTLPLDVFEEWAAVLNRIIWATMAVDIGWIKDADEAKEFHNRYMIWCANNGLAVDIHASEIERYIGLRTNVTRLSRFKWDEKQRKLHGFK